MWQQAALCKYYIATKGDFQNLEPIKIKRIQANSLYQVNEGYKDSRLDLGDAVINNSLFSKYMIRHGVTVNKRNKSTDFVVIDFKYGVLPEGAKKNAKPEITAQELRDYYYNNGASVTWDTYNKDGEIVNSKTVKYKMLMRSTGKAKQGKCVFIREDLHKTALDYLTMELHYKMPFENAGIVEMSAYCTMVTATATGFISIPMENILIIQDETVSSLVRAVTVKSKEEIIGIDYEATESYINGFGLTFCKSKLKEKIEDNTQGESDTTPKLKYIRKSQKSLEKNGISLSDCPTKKRKVCYVDRGNDGKSEVENVLWDGMGICDESIFPSGEEGFIYLRSHFFKSCLFRGNIQEYFKNWCKEHGEDYETKKVKDMFGYWHFLKDIKVITTNNSIKWIKFKDLMGGTERKAYRYYRKYMRKCGNEYAIVKSAHPSKWGELQRGSFQIYGTLPTTDEKILKKIATPSIDYFNNISIYHDAFINHLKITGSSRYSINNVLIELDKLNDKFRYTDYFREKKNDITSKFKKERLQLGKLFQNGDNLTICGNVIALLMKVVGENPLDEPCFNVINDGIQCCTTRFKEGERIAGFRSPHNSPNNIVHLVNVYPEAIKKYFPQLGNNVIIINGIGSDCQSRLNGQDLDTDSLFATNQPEMAKLARKAYLDYPTIINGIKPIGNSQYNNDMKSYAEMDNKISASQTAIGRASNIAQLALSYYYHDGDDNEDLQDVFIICSVLAQVAIDGAKRNFDIDLNPELNRLADLPCMKRDVRYPRFYDDVQKNKPHYCIKEDQVGDFNCPMDILYRIIDKGVIDKRKWRGLTDNIKYNFSTVFEYKPNERRSEQYKKIISIAEEYDKDVKKLDTSSKDYSDQVEIKFDKCIRKLDNLTISIGTMSALIQYAFLPNGGIRDRLLTILYDKDPEKFLKCFKSSAKKA